MNTCYTSDGAITHFRMQLQPFTCSGVQRNSTTACIQDKVERVGKSAQSGFKRNNTAGKDLKWKLRNKPGGRLNKFFLSVQMGNDGQQ